MGSCTSGELSGVLSWWGGVLVGNCPGGSCPSGEIVLVGSCPVGEIS